jgi:ATP-binding cassette, subfamily B (MDR/TAP), member 1
MYLMLAFVQLIANVSYGVIFGYSQERLIHRARLRLFKTLLRQDIAFFDLNENNPGALTSILSTSIIHLAGLSGTTIGTVLSVLTTLISSVTLSIVIGWKLALICTSTIPVLLLCGFLRYYILANFHARSQAVYQASAAYACEATSAIRTVAALTRESHIWDEYEGQLKLQVKRSLISISKSTILFALSQSLNFFCVALGFWYGGTLIAQKQYSLFQFFVCFMAIIFGAQTAGTIFSFAPDMGRAKYAAIILNGLFERTPSVDIWDKKGDILPDINGDVELRGIHFHYPSRPQHPVLCGVDLFVKSGQTAALVGPSGCGKSTIIALLERFYGPDQGSILVDGKDISELNLKDYRHHLALVSQEPTLYEGTIRENILLGVDEDVIEADIELAAKEANILDFIKSLPSVILAAFTYHSLA